MCNKFKITSGLIFLTIILTLVEPTASLAKAKRPERGQVRKTVTNFKEVEIVLNDKFSSIDIETLPQAPGTTLKVLGNGQRIRTQLPASQVKALTDKGVDITVLRNFVLIENSTHKVDSLYGETRELQTLAISNEYGENGTDVSIPDDDSGWASSPIYDISGAPVDATVTSVDVHYEILHDYVGDLTVELSDEDYSTYAYLLWEDPFDNGSYINETETGITAFNGKSVNQMWVLWALDGFPYTDEGYIDYWWIKVYYNNGGGGSTDYCTASGGCDEYISRVQVETIDNSSGCDGYGDYTAISTEMEIDQSYGITVTNGSPFSQDRCGIWVDWNQDEDFEDAGETIAVTGSPGPGPYTATITPPADANLGDTRMRVRIVYNQIPAPCGTSDFGEVEDYTITIPESYAGDFVSPYGVNFLDSAVFVSAWYSQPGDGNWNAICDISKPNDNVIDELDLAVFVENWLRGVE